MSFRKIIVGVAGLLFLAGQVKAQDPMGLYFMETIPQTKHTNPAMQPRANGFFALPNVNQLFQSDLAFSDVFQDVGSEIGRASCRERGSASSLAGALRQEAHH